MNCIQGNILLLDQLRALLETLNDDMLQKSLSAFGGSTIGQHIRHIYDFYDCILRGQQGGEIDYGDRQRNQFIEKHVVNALAAFNIVEDRIESLSESETISVLTDFSTDVTVDRMSVKSSIGRELMFACDHAVHHLAMIKMGMRAHFPEMAIDSQLGMAPSTIKNEQGEHVSE